MVDMGKRFCAKEQLVCNAVRAGSLIGEIAAHVKQCASCSDAVLVAKYLANAPVDGNPPALPEPGVLWLKAQLRARDAALAKATRPISWMTSIGAFGCSVAGAWFAFSLHGAAVAQHFPSIHWVEMTFMSGIGAIICALIGSVAVARP
jgi:hypothetical protein